MVILVNVPLKFHSKYNYVLDDSKMPLGLTYLASFLKSNNIDVKIVDSLAKNLTINETMEEIKKYKPDFIGLNCLSLNQNEVFNLIKTIKFNLPNVPVIVGGIHPTLAKSRLLEENDYIDVLVIGEGEISLLDLINNYNNKEEVAGIIYKNKNKVIETQKRPRITNLDSLPFPAIHLLPIDLYLKKEKRISIIASRGCPYNCKFCASPIIWKRKVYCRTPENVIKEIKENISKYNIYNYQFLDDEFFNWPYKELIKFLELAKQLNIKWRAIGRIDILNKLNYFYPNFIINLKESGCYKLTFGIESGSVRIQKFMGKNINLNIVEDVIHYCNKVGIETKAYFMIGFPTESPDEIYETINLSLKLKKVGLKYAVFLPVMVYYGTDLYNYIIKKEPNYKARDVNDVLLVEDYDESLYINKLLKRYSYLPKQSINEFYNNKEIRKIIKYAYKQFYSYKVTTYGNQKVFIR